MTTTVVERGIAARFNAWVRAEAPWRSLVIFRRLFAAIWLTYDGIDYFMGQTVKNLWFLRVPLDPRLFTALQLLLIFCEVGLLVGYRARWFAFGAFLGRAAMSYLFALNDFLYFTVVALILSQCDCDNGAPKKSPVWPRDVLVLQTAWIYLASAVLKLNPLFLSGGDLYVRQNYTARVMPFYYPQFYLRWIAQLSGDRLLAWTAVLAELTLAGLIFLWWRWPRHRMLLRWPLLFLALAIHAYAIYALDVFFFSFSMIAQVVTMTAADGAEVPAN